MLYDVEHPRKSADDFVAFRVHEFTKGSAKKFEAKIEKAYHNGQQIVPVTIDSNGGDVHSALSMLETIKAYEAHSGTVLTYVKGRAKSAALALLSFGTAGYRFSAPTSHLMFHQGALGMGKGKMESLRSRLKYGEAMEEKFMKAMARRCGHDDSYFIELVERQGNINNYMEPEEAVNHNLIDHICRPKVHVLANNNFQIQKT